MSRPLYDIKSHLEEIDKLCQLQCTGEEIASFLDIDYDTLNRRLEQETGLSFTEYFEQKRGAGKISLRRKQLEKALGGDTVMLIWLGKQWLQQTDKQELTAIAASTQNKCEITAEDADQILKDAIMRLKAKNP